MTFSGTAPSRLSATAAKLYEGEYPYGTDGHVERIGHDARREPYHRHGVGRVEEERSGSEYHYDDVIPGDMIDSLDPLPYREGEESQQDYHSHEEW